MVKKIVLFLLLTVSIFANSTTNQEYKNDLQTLENKIEANNNRVTASLTEFDKSWDTKTKEITEKTKDVDKSLTIIYGVLGFFGLSILGGSILLLRKTKSLILQKIVSTIEKDEDIIKKIIHSEDYENKLKKTKKLLVVYETNGDNENIKKVLKEFKNVRFKEFSDNEDIISYDLIIFSYQKQDTTNYDKLEDIIRNNQEKIFVYYNTTRDNLKQTGKVNHSNSEITLYSSVMNALKYQDLINTP